VANWSQFDEMENKPIECELFEAMCPDAVDGTLTPAERRVFDRHAAECKECREELAEAQRGNAWLGMLKGQTPEPPPSLLTKILAETTGAAEQPAIAPEIEVLPVLTPVLPVRDPAPAWALSSVLRRTVRAFRINGARSALQPRLAMTAAMAFVSIALTLNLTGVRLSNLRASNFTPSAIRRSVADTSASMARSIQNMRVVYQVESRVSELRGEGPLAERQASFVETDQPRNSVDNNDANDGTAHQPENTQAPRRKGL
jgi:hypothetical protein